MINSSGEGVQGNGAKMMISVFFMLSLLKENIADRHSRLLHSREVTVSSGPGR